jgi:zinc protease
MFIPDEKPDRAPSPPAADIAAMVKEYKGDASVAAGETFEPTPANLEARTQRFTLPNGMKVALLPKKTRGETVQFQLRLNYGDEASLQGMSPRGGLAASMLSRGTKKRDRQAFEDALDQLRAKLAISGAETELTAHGGNPAPISGPPPYCRSAARNQPSSDEFDKLKREQLAALDEQATIQAVVRRPSVAGTIRTRRATCAMPTFEEEQAEIATANLDDAKAFWRASSAARIRSSRSSAISIPARCARSRPSCSAHGRVPRCIHACPIPIVRRRQPCCRRRRPTRPTRT